MTEKDTSPRRSSLHARHESLGARFEAWTWGRKRKQLVPTGYGDTYGEHAAVRESAGVFDLSHVGQFLIQGPKLGDALNGILTNDVDRLNGPGKSQYTLLCDSGGGVLDEILLLRFTKNSFEFLASAEHWLDSAVTIDDYLPGLMDLGVLDGVQAVLELHGPDAAEILAGLGIPSGQEHMAFEIATDPSWAGAWTCRTDRFGAEGYVVTAPVDVAQKLWDGLVASGARPCGMGAYDLLRIEAGHPLLGSEIGPDVNPVEARMGWVVGWAKDAFHGKDALDAIRTAGPERRLWGLAALDEGVPLSGMAVFEGERRVGETTSAAYSPAIGKGIALAFLSADIKPGAELETEGGEGRVPVKVVKPRFTDADEA